MDTGETGEFLIILVAFGAVGWVYFPAVTMYFLPWVMLIGAFYLLFGIFTQVTQFATGAKLGNRADWMNGLIILTIAALYFQAGNLAVSTVQNAANICFSVFFGVLSLI